MRTSRATLRRWLARQLPMLLLTVVLGMGIGALTYYASRLTGVALYVSTGGVTAVVGGILWGWLTKSTAVSEVELTVPQFSKVKFAVTKDHRVLARRIVVEMTTRIAVQSLDDDAGRADEALASLYKLFTLVRDLLAEDAEVRPAPGRPYVDVLAMNMLNLHLRPFLSTWHRRYSDWRAANPELPESDWPDDQKFRDELRALQTDLREQATNFAKLAEYDGYLDLIGLAE